jgi:hypothetical protein
MTAQPVARGPAEQSSEPTPAAPPQSTLRAVHTVNFPELLRTLGASLLVTTYRAGKLVMVRDEGDHLNGGTRRPESARQSLAPGNDGTTVHVCRESGTSRSRNTDMKRRSQQAVLLTGVEPNLTMILIRKPGRQERNGLGCSRFLASSSIAFQILNERYMIRI